MSSKAIASRKLEISQLLQSWRPLKEKIDELIACESVIVDRLTSGAVKESERDELNEHILQRKALVRVLDLVRELKEDLHADEPSSDPDDE